jgi:hypothetical protein
MKILIALAMSATFAQCSTNHHGSNPPKIYRSSVVGHQHEQHNVISGNESGLLVTGKWLDKYRAMEKTHGGGINEDYQIYKEGDHFRVPLAVSDHFNDMVRQE